MSKSERNSFQYKYKHHIEPKLTHTLTYPHFRMFYFNVDIILCYDYLFILVMTCVSDSKLNFYYLFTQKMAN